jgi:hypothetical protein
MRSRRRRPRSLLSTRSREGERESAGFHASVSRARRVPLREVLYVDREALANGGPGAYQFNWTAVRLPVPLVHRPETHRQGALISGNLGHLDGRRIKHRYA